jgi:hypothetical protein
MAFCQAVMDMTPEGTSYVTGAGFTIADVPPGGIRRLGMQF